MDTPATPSIAAATASAGDPAAPGRPTSLVRREHVLLALTQSVRMLAPRTMMRNPVMFITEVGAAVTTMFTVRAALTSTGDLA